MEAYNDWEDAMGKSVPLPGDNFDEYFTEYNEIDNLFNETLTGLQDLDVPSGYVTKDQSNNHVSGGHQAKHGRKISGTAIFGYADHNRELSIGGLASDLYRSVKTSMDFGKSVSPGELLKSLSAQHNNPNDQIQLDNPPILDFDFSKETVESQKPILLMEEDEDEEEDLEQNKKVKDSSPSKNQKESKDYIVTNENPKSYKFPPSPSSPLHSQSPIRFSKNNKGQFQTVNNYSVKYLQNLKSQDKNPIDYVDDIGPLLESTSQVESQPNPFNTQTAYKYVPIPVQEPVGHKKESIQKLQSHQPQEVQPHHQNQQLRNTFNSFLPPPSPPTLSNGSPEWQSSPEPQSPSPSRVVNSDYSQHKFSSPVHPQLGGAKVNFYTPQFFSESDSYPTDSYEQGQSNSHFSHQQAVQQLQNEQIHQQQLQIQHQQMQIQQHQHQQQQQRQKQHFHQSSPFQSNMGIQLQSSPIYGPNKSLNSSPIKYYTSPLRNIHPTNDDTVDVNATITQLTPLKNTLPNTPARNQMRLEWSPIISPNAKASKDVKKHIQQSSVRRRVKKTSLLPPGELDHYWEGPNENKIYTCTFKGCGKEFTRRYNVRSHIQTHLSDRPFACPSCPKRFVRQHDLNRHVKGHLEARHCKCSCGKEFARLDALKKHRNRNICVGGVASNTNNCITKPQKRRSMSSEFLDDFTSEKLNDELSSSLSDEVYT